MNCYKNYHDIHYCTLGFKIASTCRIVMHVVYVHTTEGLAWDWVNEVLYWTDTQTQKIEVYDPATTHRKVLFSGIIPSDIVLDPTEG